MAEQILSIRRKEFSFDTDYGYLNARIRGMRSFLLPHEIYERLLNAKNADEIIKFLSESPYRHEMQLALTKYKGVRAAEHALCLNFVRQCRKILTITNGKPRKLIAALLGIWDAFNLKTVLRGKHCKAEWYTINDNLLPAGELDNVTLEELSKQQQLKGVIDLLSLWGYEIGRKLEKVYEEYSKTNNLRILENEVNKYFLEDAYKSIIKDKDLNSKIVSNAFSIYIDYINFINAMRLYNAGVDPDKAIDFYINCGGRITKTLFYDLASSGNIEDLITKAKDTYFADAIQKRMPLFERLGEISAFERAFEGIMIKRLCSIYRRYPLTIAIVINYIWLKYNEIVNLRVLLRLKDFGIPAKIIEEELILV